MRAIQRERLSIRRAARVANTNPPHDGSSPPRADSRPRLSRDVCQARARPQTDQAAAKRSKQQSQDSFLCLLIFLGGHPANLILHGKVLPFLATPRAVTAAPGHLFDWTCGLYPVDNSAPIGQTPDRATTLPLPRRVRPSSPRTSRRARHLSEAFALRCGIDRSHYGGMERGERNPSLTTIYKIADELKSDRLRSTLAPSSFRPLASSTDAPSAD